MKFYVYTYYDPITNDPIYVGKGKGNRCYDHLHIAKGSKVHKSWFIRKLRKMLREGREPTIVIVADNLSEENSYNLEMFLISIFGRADLRTGTLLNLTNGGTGGAISPKILKEYHADPTYRDNVRQRMLEHWKEDANKANQQRKIKDTWRDNPDRRQSTSNRMTEIWKDTRESRLASSKRYYNNPVNADAIAARHAKATKTMIENESSTFYKNNPKSKGVCTPLGEFTSQRKAAKAHSLTQWKFDQLLKSEPQLYYHVIAQDS